LAEEKSNKIPVMIPADLYEKLQEIIANGGFSSVDDYVNYVLRTKIGKEEEKQDLTEEETEVVTSRLKALGYI
jgi:Arc/MetJ-type ribon-helix-helix transcriptional regulator